MIYSSVTGKRKGRTRHFGWMQIYGFIVMTSIFLYCLYFLTLPDSLLLKNMLFSLCRCPHCSYPSEFPPSVLRIVIMFLLHFFCCLTPNTCRALKSQMITTTLSSFHSGNHANWKSYSQSWSVWGYSDVGAEESCLSDFCFPFLSCVCVEHHPSFTIWANFVVLN